MKKLLAICLVAALMTPLFAIGASAEKVVELSVWIPKGEDSVYYDSYDLNPVIQYLETLRWSDGSRVEFTFSVPISGEEKNNFNTYLATGEYCDMMHLAYCDSSIEDLAQEGIARDLTEYVEKYMPNYLAWLDAHPDYRRQAMNYVDGEWKYLTLCAFADKPATPFEGFCYRRDWLVKYGERPTHVWDLESEQVQAHGKPLYSSYADAQAQGDWTGWKPHAGEPFRAEYGDDPDNTYTDNVIFPSGGSDPVYISDWEWMLAIFDRALEAQNVADGYAFALVYNGYIGCGDFASSFGGGTPDWHRNRDNQAAFGATSDNFRAYLTCLSTWYDRGWIEKGYDQHTGDMFYAVNTPRTHMGKVGMWQGRLAELGDSMDMDTELTDGIMVVGCRFPINDLYGGAEQQMKAPDSFYQFTNLNATYMITTAADEADLPILFEMFDWMYSEEGALVGGGLNAEQLAQIPDPSLYERFGIDSAYTLETDDQGGVRKVFHPALCADVYLRNACINNRWYGHNHRVNCEADTGDPAVVRHALSQWDYYTNTGFVTTPALKLLTADESMLYNKTFNYVITFLDVNVGKFVKGQNDIADDGDWGKFCKSINKYRPENVTAIFERVYGLLFKK